jgi:hypothetical protein
MSFPVAAAARRTASRVSDATSDRAGEIVTRSVLEVKAYYFTRLSAKAGSLPMGGTLSPLSDARTKLEAFFNILV